MPPHSLYAQISAGPLLQQLLHFMLSLLGSKFIRLYQRPHELVHVDEVVPIIVQVGRVVDGVVACPHDWRHSAHAWHDYVISFTCAWV